MLDLEAEYIHLLFHKHKYVHFLQFGILESSTMNSQPSEGQLNTAQLLPMKITFSNTVKYGLFIFHFEFKYVPNLFGGLLWPFSRPEFFTNEHKRAKYMCPNRLM